MYLVAIGWMYVVLMAALAEALSANGSVLGAVITFVGWGLVPLAIVVYIGGTPARRRARLAAEAAEAAQAASAAAQAAAAGTTAPGDSAAAPDSGGHAAGAAVAPERKEG